MVTYRKFINNLNINMLARLTLLNFLTIGMKICSFSKGTSVSPAFWTCFPVAQGSS